MLFRSYDKYIETVKHMKNGTPIIYQGVLHDYKRKIFGIPDLLVRSDYLNKIFNTKIISKKQSLKGGLSKKYHYRVIEIKYITLYLCADGIHLRNSNKNNLANKGQVYIYNKILGSIQGYTPIKSYILGKKWIYKKLNELISGTSFDRVAHINFKNNDKFIRTKTANAIRWIRKLRKHGFKWSVTSPSCNELKPNLCLVNEKWQSVKKQIARDNNDITELWICGPKNRELAEARGVSNWRTHNNLTSEILGITGDKVSNILQVIIEMNQDTEKTEPYMPLCDVSKEWIIYPMKIYSNIYKWKHFQGNEFYVDFETISNKIGRAHV